MKRKSLKIALAVVLILSLVGCSTSNINDDTKKDNQQGQTSEDGTEKKDNNEKIDDNKKEESTNTNEDKPEEKPGEKVEITIEKMIPKTNLELYYKGSDLISEKDLIKVKGNVYQVIEATPKGYVVKLYTIKNQSLIKIYSGDLTMEESEDISSVDYIDNVKENQNNILLKEPLKVKTRWDNKEIVEVGQNLKLDQLQLEGAYVKSWEKTVEGDDETVKVSYYSEGLGCVMYKVILNNEVVEQSMLHSIVKR